jgi:DNA polymerase-3 subunit delta
VRESFERLGARVDSDAAHALVEVVGADPTALATEADKLATWAGGEEISRPEIEALAVPAAEDAAWALTDAWGARDLAALLGACERALEHTRPHVLALRLSSYASRLRAAQAMAEDGLGATAVAKRFRMKDFPARKLLGFARNYSPDELDAAVVRLADLDAALKGASRLAPELELERALIEITRPREPSARLRGPVSL